jgi:hypothetical protein
MGDYRYPAHGTIILPAAAGSQESDPQIQRSHNSGFDLGCCLGGGFGIFALICFLTQNTQSGRYGYMKRDGNGIMMIIPGVFAWMGGLINVIISLSRSQ